MSDRRGDPGLEPGLLDELFPVVRSPGERRERSSRAAVPRRATTSRRDGLAPKVLGSEPPDAPELPQPGAVGDSSANALTTARPRQRRAVAVGIACAALAVVVRLTLAHLLPADDVARLSLSELGLGAMVVAAVTWLCARASVPVAGCLAIACAVASLDVAAPVGVGLVLLAAMITRRR